MRAFLRVVAVAIAALIACAATVPPAQADTGRPTWTAGDFWVYGFNGTFYAGSLFTLAGPGSYRFDVLGVDSIVVGNVSYSAYAVQVAMNVPGTTVFNGGEYWYRTSDLALVKTLVNVTADVFLLGRVTIITTIDYDPPVTVQWPLTASASWSSSSNSTVINQVLNGGSFVTRPRIDAQSTVLAGTTVRVPAGSFDVTPLRTQTNGYVVAYWSPTAGNQAKQQTFAPNNQETSSSELRAWKYQGTGFLGLPLVAWLLIILVAILVIVGLLWRRRQKKGVFTAPPPGVPP